MSNVRSLLIVVLFLLLAGLFGFAGPLDSGAGLLSACFAQTVKPPLQKQQLTNEDIWRDTPLTGGLPESIRWVPDNRGISYLETLTPDSTEQTFFCVSSVPSGKKRVVCIVDTVQVPEDLKKNEDDVFSMDGYQWAKTGGFVIFTFEGDVFTMQPKDGAVHRLTQTEDREKNVDPSPDGTLAAYVRENDLYIIDIAGGAETRVTSTGCDSILNGCLDWVYMEELYSRGNTRAFWWSPDGKRIAFLEFDESPVPEYPLVDYKPLHASLDMQRYPEPGDPNPLVRVGLYDVASARTMWLDSLKTPDEYVARVDWLEDSHALAVQILNRPQTELRLVFADAVSGKASVVLTERDSTWVNLSYMQHFYKHKPRFVWSSERDGFRHLYLYGNDGKLLNKLTAGPWEVTDLDGVDEEKGWVYCTTLEKSVLEQHLYKVSADGKKMERITKEEGAHSIRMSEDCRYYIDTYSNAARPPVISVRKNDGKKLFTLGESSTDVFDTYDIPVPELFSFTSEEGVTYYCSIMKPNDFDPAKRYPVIISVYGGPHAQVVSNRWGGSSQLWRAMMASKGYISFSLDNRGSAGRGKAWEDAIAREFCSIELHDQLVGVEYLKKLPFVDASRIGIWGWSYGGSMTCTALLKAPDVFKAGVAVAPVTDFRLYDSIYTERYMGTPAENEEGYARFNLLDKADSLRASFLLVHGTSDDNVHMQNSIDLIDKLITAGKDFDLMLYPGKEHSISGTPARRHLFNKITKFFEEKL